MSPRIVAAKSCPRCRAKLEQPTPRVCPACGASLQKRFLSLGCLSSAPPIVIALAGAAMLARDSGGSTPLQSAVFAVSGEPAPLQSAVFAAPRIADGAGGDPCADVAGEVSSDPTAALSAIAVERGCMLVGSSSPAR